VTSPVTNEPYEFLEIRETIQNDSAAYDALRRAVAHIETIVTRAVLARCRPYLHGHGGEAVTPPNSNDEQNSVRRTAGWQSPARTRPAPSAANLPSRPSSRPPLQRRPRYLN